MPAYNRQLKDKDDNLIYPVLNSDSIPGNAVTTAKIADGAVTSAKIGTGEVKATNIDFTTFDTGWQKVPLSSAMSESASNTGGLWYRNMNGIVHLYGQIKKGSGNFDSQEVLATLPDAAMPYLSSSYPNESTPLIVSASGGAIVRIAVQNADNNLIYNASATSPWVFLSISYKGKVS